MKFFINRAIKRINRLSKKRIPFILIIDFEFKNIIIKPLNKINNNEIMFEIKGIKNYKEPLKVNNKEIILTKKSIDFHEYKKLFDAVIKELEKGNSFLVNLTFQTEIEIDLTLKEIFFLSDAKYKLYYKDRFVFFSPEQFVIIKNNKISSYPMKGTIDASIPNAKEMIMKDEKEFAEHITIVDLIRNDLGIIGKDIEVKKFRYIDEIITNNKKLLQVSSEVTANLPVTWRESLGNIIFSLLPAGSVTGAPKKKTVEIIKKVENYKRGFYTGIFGYYDGEVFDSCVMIRFIEKKGGKFYYKSGGGITIYSDPEKEYNELLDKIYVPVRNNQNKK